MRDRDKFDPRPLPQSGRIVQVANQSDLIALVQNGYVDNRLADLEAAIRSRRAEIREEVLKQVKDVLGGAALDAVLAATEGLEA